MKLLNKYILKGYIKIFLIIQIVMIWIFLVVDYLSNLDKFVEAGLKSSRGLYFVFLKIPFVIVHLTPVSIVLSCVIYFGLMNKHKEIIALCSSGISIKKIYAPVMILSVVLSLCVFFVSNALMPSASSKLNRILVREIKKKNIMTEKKNNIWIKDNNRIIFIDFFNSGSGIIRNITINEFDDKNSITSRIHADTAVYKNEKWDLENVNITKDLNKPFGQKIEFKTKKRENLNFSPGELKEVVKHPDEMGIFHLKKYITQLKEKGYDAKRYIVDFHRKIAFPFVCIIMAIIGSIIGINSSTGKRIPFGVAASLGISFLYWSLYSFSISLGYGEKLFPFAAAWSANLIFGISGVLFIVLFEKKLIQS